MRCRLLAVPPIAGGLALSVKVGTAAAQVRRTTASATAGVDVAHAGHMVVGDGNDAFKDAVLAFVTELQTTDQVNESVA